MKWLRGVSNQATYLTENPAVVLEGLPSAMAVGTTHPEGDASSANSHSPQGARQPQSQAVHHPKYGGHHENTDSILRILSLRVINPDSSRLSILINLKSQKVQSWLADYY